MCQEYSLCPYSTIYVPMVLFMFLEDSLCDQSSVHVLTVQFISLEYSISPHSTFYHPKYSLCS